MPDPGAGLVPPLLRAPVLAALFWWVALALGRRILLWLRVPLASLTLWEKGLISVSIGAGFIQYLPYTLAAMGRLSARAVLVSLGILALLLARDLWQVARALRAKLATVSLRRLSAPTAVWAGLFAATMGILLVRAVVLTDFGSDDDGYHLSAPKRWLEMGTLGYLPTYTNTNAAAGFEMLYVFGLATGNPLGVKVLHYSAGLFALLGLWLSARRLGSGTAGLIAISALLIATPICNLPYLFTAAYVDLGACWMAMTSVLLWLVLRERPHSRVLLCLALCVGFAASFKLTALSMVVAWIPVLAHEAHRQRLPRRRILGVLLHFGVVAALPVLPWMLRNWRETGNPIFPMLPGVFPTRDWSPAVGETFSKMLHYYSWGLSSGAGMSEAMRRALVVVTTLLMLLAAGAALVLLRRTTSRALVVLAAVFGLISVQMAGLVFRYWIPALMCAALVAALSLSAWRGARWLPWLAPSLMAAALAVLLLRPVTQPTHPLLTDLRVATGLTSFSQAHRDSDSWKMWTAINAGTPADARILMAAFYPTFGACNFGAFWVDRKVYTSDAHAQQFIAYHDEAAFLRSIDGAGITHVVLSDQVFLAGRYGFSFAAAENEYPLSRRLVDERGERLQQFGHLQLYRLRPTTLGAARAISKGD